MISAESCSSKFLTKFSNGEHICASDTTPDKGGGNLGFRPHELLEAALANCMNMSLRMSAEKLAIPISGVSVTVTLNRNASEGPTFEYAVEFCGSLTEAQKGLLLNASENCPVRTTLSKPLHFKRCKP